MAPPRIIAATDTGIHVLDTDDRITIEGGLTALAASPEGELVAATGAGRLIRSADAFTWSDLTTLEGPPVRCVFPNAADVLVGTAEAGLFSVSAVGTERVTAFDQVDGRDEWFTPWGGPPDTRSLAAYEGGIYANVHVGGIPRSRDGGATWEPTIEVAADVHQVVATSGLVLAPCASGLAISSDGGDAWRVDDEGLHASYCRAAAVSGEALLVSASTGPFSRRAAVYRRALGSDGAFERCEGGLPDWFSENVDTHLLAARDGTVAIAGADGRVWRSDDDGTTWDLGATIDGSVRAVVVAP